MRKIGLGLGLTFLAGASGLAVGGAGAAPAVGAILGACLVVAVSTYFGVGTDRLAFLAVGAMVLTVTWNGVRIGGGAFGDGFMALAFLAVLANVFVKRRSVPLPPWLCAAAVCCLLSAMLVVIFPPSNSLVQKSILTETNFLIQDGGITSLVTPRTSISTLVKFELSLTLIPVLIAAVGTSTRRCSRLMDLWTISGMINAAVGAADYFGVAHLAPVALAANRSAGLTVQSNYLALTCVITIPTALLWFGRSRRWNVAGAIALMTLLAGVYASGSRAGTVAALIALGATMSMLPRLRSALRVVLPLAGIALVAVLMFTNTGGKILKQVRLGSSNQTSLSNNQRSTAADVAWTQIQARPLEGVGFFVIADAHDVYLELLAAGGVIAMAGFLTFCGGLLGATRKALSGPHRDAALALAVAVVAWLANGVFDNQLADKYLYVVPGLLLAISRLPTPTQRAPLPRRPAAAQPMLSRSLVRVPA